MAEAIGAVLLEGLRHAGEPPSRGIPPIPGDSEVRRDSTKRGKHAGHGVDRVRLDSGGIGRGDDRGAESVLSSN